MRAVILAALTWLLWASAAPATSPRDLVEIHDFSGLSISPDGAWVVYRLEHPSITRNSIAMEWYVVSSDGHTRPRSIGDGGAPLWDSAGLLESGVVIWGADSRSVYYRALVDGAVEIWRASIDGSVTQAFVTGDADVETFALIDDARLIYVVGPSRAQVMRAEEAEYDKGVLVDDRVDLAQGVYRSAIVRGRPASQRLTGFWFEREGLLARSPRRYLVRDLRSGRDRNATPAEIAMLDQPPPRTRDVPPSVVTRAVHDHGLCSQRPACGISEQVKVVATSWAPDRDAVVLTTEDAGIGQALHVWSPADGGLRTIARSDGLLSGSRRDDAPCAVAHDAVLCIAASAGEPPRLVRVPFDGGPWATLADPNASSRPRSIRFERLEWRNGRGQPITAWLLRPKGGARVPLFVTYYRCEGFLRGGLGDEWPLAAFAEQGIAALCINAKVVRTSTAVERYTTGLDVVQAAISMLDARGLIDPKRVGMGGLSFGSEVAMWVATHSSLLAAVSIASVQIEPSYYWYNHVAGRDHFAENLARGWGLTDPVSDATDWRRLSPALNADRIHAPVLMQLPEQEARLSTELHSRLSMAHIGELYVFPDAPHIKALPRQKLAAYVRNLDWFRFWLQGHVDPDPDKTSQYARWRAIGAGEGQYAASIDSIQSSRSASSISRK